MQIPIQADSLQSLTQLANNPPRYVSRRDSEDRRQLKLYIVRVPASQDLILTTLKPRSLAVSADDIISCLYYLRVEAQENESWSRAGSSQSIPTLQSNNPQLPPRPPPKSSLHLPDSFSHLSLSSNRLQASFNTSVANMSSVSDRSRGGSTSYKPMASQDFKITIIRRDRVTGEQQTIGQISSNMSAHEVDLPSSTASAMFAQQIKDSKRHRRERQQLSLEIWNPGYEKFVAPKRTRYPPPKSSGASHDDATRWSDWAYAKRDVDSRVVDSKGASTDKRQSRLNGDLPPPPPPPHDPNYVPRQSHYSSALMKETSFQPQKPASEPVQALRLSQFMEMYSPDSSTDHSPDTDRPTMAQNSSKDDPSHIFSRTLELEGDGFWKVSSKRFSGFVNHHRSKSSVDVAANKPQIAFYDEETRQAMAQMGIETPDSSQSKSDELKLKGYAFDAPTQGAGRCEFESNAGGRKLRLKLHPPSSLTTSEQRRSDAILLATLSFQNPDSHNRRPSSPSLSPDPSSSSSARRKSLSPHKNPFKGKLAEKFKPKSRRQNSWTQYVDDYDPEAEVEGKCKAKLGSLTVESEGQDMLDLVVISSMGVFRKKWEEWVQLQGRVWGTS